MTPATCSRSKLSLLGDSLHRPVRRAGQLILVMLPFAFGCQGDRLTPSSPVDPDRLFWELELNHRAALLSSSAPGYDTLTLVATPRTVHGEVLTDVGSPTYESRDLDRVRVSPDGVLHAIAPTDPGQPVTVLATLTVGNLKHIDSVMVAVVDNPDPPVLTTFSAHPVPPDSAKTGIGGGLFYLPVQAADAHGDPIPDLPISVRPSDPDLVTYVPQLNRWQAVGGPGTLTFYVSTTAFGVAKADTVPYRVGMPVFFFSVNVVPTKSSSGLDSVVFSPDKITVGTGAAVLWIGLVGPWALNADSIAFADHDVSNIAAGTAFAPLSSPDPSAYLHPLARLVIAFNCGVRVDCSAGNIPLFDADDHQGAVRVFPVPGVYEYRSTRFGARGRITVVDER